MKFRPVFVLVTTVALTIFGYAVMFLYYLMQPQCIDDLSEISDFVLLSVAQCCSVLVRAILLQCTSILPSIKRRTNGAM